MQINSVMFEKKNDFVLFLALSRKRCLSCLLPLYVNAQVMICSCLDIFSL